MDSHQSFDENWARSSDMVNLLAYMLAFPLADHSTAVKQVLLGGLRAAQLHSLTRATNSLDFSKTRWKGSVMKNKAVALHIWLYHFLGGSEHKLVPPPTVASKESTQWSVNMRVHALRKEEKYKPDGLACTVPVAL